MKKPIFIRIFTAGLCGHQNFLISQVRRRRSIG